MSCRGSDIFHWERQHPAGKLGALQGTQSEDADRDVQALSRFEHLKCFPQLLWSYEDFMKLLATLLDLVLTLTERAEKMRIILAKILNNRKMS